MLNSGRIKLEFKISFTCLKLPNSKKILIKTIKQSIPQTFPNQSMVITLPLIYNGTISFKSKYDNGLTIPNINPYQVIIKTISEADERQVFRMRVKTEKSYVTNRSFFLPIL